MSLRRVFSFHRRCKTGGLLIFGVLLTVGLVSHKYYQRHAQSDENRDLRDTLKDISATNLKKLVWVIFAKENTLGMDLLLQSLKGVEIKLIARNSNSSEMEKTLKKHHETEILSTIAQCGDSADYDVLSAWMQLIKKVRWSLQSDVLMCFTTDTVALHPDAIAFLRNTAVNPYDGLMLLSSRKLIPFCCSKTAWKQIATKLDRICGSMHNDSWKSVLLEALKLSGLSSNVVSPNYDLALDLSNCPITNDTISDGCTNSFNTFANTQRQDYKIIKQTLGYGIEKPMKSRVKDFIEYHENVCNAFQFHVLDDDRKIYLNKPIDGKGENAYMIYVGPVCINTSRVSVSAGGENVTAVLGRPESSEFPINKAGAFKVHDRVPSKSYGSYYQKRLLEAAEATDEVPAEFDVLGTTIAYTRGDYANVCFLVNDLFNIYVTMKHIRANHMLWLDGHASSNTDEVTPTLFDVDVVRLGRLDGTRCFENLVLLPDKYLLYYKQKLTARNVTDFIEKIYRKYGVEPSRNKHDTVIIRGYYLAHPRVTKDVTRKFSEKELQDVKAKLPNAKYVKFHELSWRSQLQTIANTRTLYGIHGAGLQLGLFLEKGSNVVEWMHPSRKSQMTFKYLMTWRPDVSFKRLFLKQWLASNLSDA